MTRSVLRTPAKKFTNFRDPWLASFLAKMRSELTERDGVGIAAPQLEVARRIAVAELSSGFLELVNPEIITRAGEEVGGEGCLSLLGQRYAVARPTSLVVRYQDRAGRWRKIRTTGRDARILSHEIDHLRGVLIADVGDRLELGEPESEAAS